MGCVTFAVKEVSLKQPSINGELAVPRYTKVQVQSQSEAFSQSLRTRKRDRQRQDGRRRSNAGTTREGTCTCTWSYLRGYQLTPESTHFARPGTYILCSHGYQLLRSLALRYLECSAHAPTHRRRTCDGAWHETSGRH